jgi:hypothetical protein
MRRRNFIKLTGLGAAIVAIPSLVFASTTPEEAVVGLIRNEFPYLQLDQKGVEQFAIDYYKANKKLSSFAVQLKMKTCYFAKLDRNQSELVSDVISKYLFATDFFLNKMDETKPVNYLGMFNPYKTPCANPFSFIYYPPEVIS